MLGEYALQAWSALRARPLRSLLTMLGVIIGVAAVITTVSIGAGAQQQIAQRIQALGTNLLIVQPARTRPGERFVGNPAAVLKLEDAAALADAGGPIVAVAPEVRRDLQVIAGRESASMQVIGTTPSFPAVRGYQLARGRVFGEAETEFGRQVAVLGAETVAQLYGPLDPLGDTVRIGGVEFEVVGILAAKGVAGAENRDDIVLVPVTTALQRLFGGRTIQRVYVAAAAADEMDAAALIIGATLRRQHRLTSDKVDDFQLSNQQDLLEASTSVTATFTLLLGAVAAVSLLVGGIGIMNIMLVSVTERTREIGIRKAVGATSGAILSQFLVEALVLSLVGGLLGVGAGVGSARVVSVLAGWPTMVSVPAIVLAFSFAAGIGLGFGLYPASRAARMPPLEALRFE